MADFLTTLQSFESGDWRHPERGGNNIANTHEGTSSGQAQGYNQITTGTWKEFGGLAYAPTPMQATPEQQNAIAAKIPLKRWAPETLAYLRNHGFQLNPSATLAENVAANKGTMSVATPPHGTTLNSVPMDQSIISRSSAQPAPYVPTLGENLQRGNYGAALAQLAGNEDGKEKQGPLEKFADAFKPKEAPNAPAASSEMLPQDTTPMIGPAAQQLLASTFANAAKPLSWSSQPYGYGIAGPQVPGMTLNSGGPYV